MVSSSAVSGPIRARSFALRRPAPPPGMPRSSVWSEVAGNARFDGKSVFGLIWHHGRAGVRTRAAESARLHGRAVGRFPSDRTEQNPRERPPCYYPRRRGSSKSGGRTARCAVEMPAAPTPTQRDWRVIKINYPPNEGTQTPADCALTAPPVRRINWRPSLPRLRGIGRACRHSALVAWAVTGQRRAQSTADKKTETAVR